MLTVHLYNFEVIFLMYFRAVANIGEYQFLLEYALEQFILHAIIYVIKKFFGALLILLIFLNVPVKYRAVPIT